jgi:hypothetical protein
VTTEQEIVELDRIARTIDRTLDEIERELGARLDLHQRIAVTHALERLEDAARHRACLECEHCPY